MAIDPSDRDAYERGVNDQDRGFIETFVGKVSDFVGPTESESESEAYRKGLSGEQFDGDKDDGGGGCFLSSACLRGRGLTNDCLELRTLRNFRDSYISKRLDGDSLIAEYYKTAPKIVNAIEREPSTLERYDEIYRCLIAPILLLIEEQRFEEALQLYSEFFQNLKDEFASSLGQI